MKRSRFSKAAGQTVSSRPTFSVFAGSLYAVRHLRPAAEESSETESPWSVSMQV